MVSKKRILVYPIEPRLLYGSEKKARLLLAKRDDSGVGGDDKANGEDEKKASMPGEKQRGLSGDVKKETTTHLLSVAKKQETPFC